MRWLRSLYDRALAASSSRRAEPLLGLMSFAESMVFPIPPDVMLIPMCLARPARAWRYALLCSVASILGGAAGYALGAFAWQAVGDWFLNDNVPGITEARFNMVLGWYERWDFWVIFTAGFTPIPYKLFTISAGVFEIAFPTFLLASAVGRSARFFLVAGLLKRYGEPARAFIERRFALLAYAFVALLIGGFWLLGRL